MAKLLNKFLSDFKDITEYYNFLIKKTKNHEHVDITNEWLIDNYYILAEHKNGIIANKKSIKKNSKIINDNYVLLKNIVAKKKYNIDFKFLVDELKKYQKESKVNMSYRELEFIVPTLIFIYTERLNNLCRDEYKKIIDRQDIENIINTKNNITLESFIQDNFDLKNNGYYIFEINNQIYKLKNSAEVFKSLNEYLQNREISLKDLISEEYQNKIDSNVLISNIFNDFTEFSDFSLEELYEKVSKTEKLLISDPNYKNMTLESKALYRKKIVALAKKKRTNEYDYLESIYSDDTHIGFKLFKEKNNTFRFVLYASYLFIVTTVISILLSKYFISYRILGTIILWIPISQLIVQITNQIITAFVPAKIVPKLDFSSGIPDDARTMVVIPTIVSDKEKIKAMFDALESFYLVNKTDNLYFTLLGDVKAYNEKVADFDEELMEYGKNYATDLNKKYKKDLFYFIYRKRVWNKKENSYLGYERKRGALLHFNKVLLGEYVDEEKYFNVNMLHNNKLNIKYVITLDADTKLVLNSALNLVGAMAHPLNRPVLNNNNTKVISGYGIMQPRVGVDIEATNKSLYSQIFAGIGGFDTYSALVPNIYQDLFGEGSFIGKGIYDVEVFDKVLSNTFPENLILSHDLLEGNYLRCAFVSDIELIDGFPSKFLVDTTRHHRWARGDTQIIGWLLNKVYNKNKTKVKNPINLLGKYKILDNIIRMFLFPMLLIILLLSFTFDNYLAYVWVIFVVLELTISVIFFLRSKMTIKERHKKRIYYKKLFFGGKSILFRSYINFSTIPFYTKLYMDAFFRTLYRLFYSHKNLLNWITAEEVEKTSKGNLLNYIRNFIVNIIVAIIFAVIGFLTNNIVGYILCLVFLSAPFILYLVSKDINHNKIELNDKEIADITDVARSTWSYFEDNLCEEYNYLIPDNYQENREEKLDGRTSPTAIGFSLTAVVSAYELEFIDKEKAIFLLDKILNAINSLDKWHGHLYNWYDIKTMRVINPYFVSTVDSGNLVASIVVVREFLNKLEEESLVKLCDKLIKNTNFKSLYTKRNVFSIGYDEDEGKLSGYNYNNFASESRLTSYLAICFDDAPSKHWFSLDKSLTTHKGHKGIVSWSGTAFEYYMPLLFMKNYPNTLLDETYNFAYFCQKDYINGISRKLPWGISESAYNELDNSLNYKYKAFSTPYLKIKEDAENRIVLSPYSSLMVLDLFPDDVYNNILKFKDLDMYDKYGFYDAYDYDNKGVVRSYYAHHEGMILLGIVNYLKDDAIRELFHSNINIKTFELLLKEKVQVKSSIDLKMAGYKKYNYNKETIENDIRYFNYISKLPETSVLSNKKYSLIMNDRGNSFSRYRTLQLNRYRKVTKQDYGVFLFAKDLSDNYIWSNTYAPMNIKPDKYEVVFATDKIKFMRRDRDISTKTEIVVCKSHHAEIRKITFKNESSEDKNIELTSYTEPILSENMNDISHKAFNNMFITTEFDYKTNSLIAKRRNKISTNANNYMFTKMFIPDVLDNYTFETERGDFIGRNNYLYSANGLNEKLNNYAGDNLDPILAIRNTITIPANESVHVYLIVGFGRSNEQIKDIIDYYDNKSILDKEFRISTLMNVIDTKTLNISGEDMRTYNIMLNYLYQITKVKVDEERFDVLRHNALGQNGLWKFGISGDRPVISMEIDDISKLSLVMELLKAFEYYKNKSIFVDMIIINSETGQSQKLIKKQIDDELYRMYTLNSFYHTPGSVTVIEGENITNEDRSLLDMVPRIKLEIGNNRSLKEIINNYNKNGIANNVPRYLLENNIPYVNKERLSFDNGYGGFKSNGREYVIYNKDTPAPWCNIIANGSFGTVITNNGCGFTYAYNSSEFKISSWNNETVLNDKTEGFNFDGRVFDPTKCTHGFGYSVLESETNELYHEVTEFVALNDNVKIYLMNVKNKTDRKLVTNVEYWLNPVLGNFEDKTARYILTEFMGDDNYLKMRNVYSIGFGDINVFMSSSEKIESTVNDNMLIKSISFNLNLEKNEEKTLVFVLGCSLSDSLNKSLINKYVNITNAKRELKLVKDYWNKTLGVVQVTSPDKSFDYIINGWYLYQTMSSRIMARAGFYQVSGAFGYRDQLQDAMNIAMVNPKYTKDQILNNASHQFENGEVVHWWHQKNHFGLRSRYKDDYLWLVYATTYYIETTDDYSILDEQIPYIVGEELSEYETEKGIVFNYTETTGSLFEHCIKSIDLAISSLGPHKLPLMGGGDWNDGMNKVGIKGSGESIWLGFFLYTIIEGFNKIIKKSKVTFDITKYNNFNTKLRDNLNKKAWDGEYYLRAFYDNGDKLGSHENNECKIDLISQSFSIISDVIPKERIEPVIKSVEENLVDDKLSIVKLLTPPFDKTLNNPGYIMNYSKGIRENGGQYTHAVSWYLMALIKTGYHDRAYRYFQMINPINRTTSSDDVKKYRVEPYVIAADIYSSDVFGGRGGWTWYTGSAGWFYRVGVQELLGIRKLGDKLKLNPRLPVSWDHVSIKYTYMDTIYNIEVKKAKVDSIKIDGKEIKNDIVNLNNDKREHLISISYNTK